jgi:predicted secreted Zn-dependent protease
VPIPLLAALFASATAAQAESNEASAFADLPNVQLRHYDVAGLTIPEIRKAINASRPADPSGVAPGLDALTRWRIDYGWETEEKEGCRVTSAEATFQAEIILPRLVPPSDPKEEIPAKVREKWDKYMAALQEHEARYLRQAHQGLAEVEKAVRASGCETARQAGATAIEALTRREAEQRALKEDRLKVKF